MLHRFVIEVGHLELLVGLIGPRFRPGQGPAATASPSPFFANLRPPLLLFFLGDQRHLDAVTSQIQPRNARLPCGNLRPSTPAAIRHAARHAAPALPSLSTNCRNASLLIDQCAARARFAAVFSKAAGILVQATRHLPDPFADRRFGFIQPAICRRFASFLPAVPTNPPYVDPPIDGQDAGGLHSFMPFPLSRRGAVRRGEKRLPPHSLSSGSAFS